MRQAEFFLASKSSQSDLFLSIKHPNDLIFGHCHINCQVLTEQGQDPVHTNANLCKAPNDGESTDFGVWDNNSTVWSDGKKWEKTPGILGEVKAWWQTCCLVKLNLTSTLETSRKHYSSARKHWFLTELQHYAAETPYSEHFTIIMLIQRSA